MGGYSCQRDLRSPNTIDLELPGELTFRATTPLKFIRVWKVVFPRVRTPSRRWFCQLDRRVGLCYPVNRSNHKICNRGLVRLKTTPFTFLPLPGGEWQLEDYKINPTDSKNKGTTEIDQNLVDPRVSTKPRKLQIPSSLFF